MSTSQGGYFPQAELNADGINVGFDEPISQRFDNPDIIEPFGVLGLGSQCNFGNPNCMTCYLDGFEHDCGQVMQLAQAGALQIKVQNDQGQTRYVDVDVMLGVLYVPGRTEWSWEQRTGGWEFNSDDPNDPPVWNPTLEVSVGTLNTFQAAWIPIPQNPAPGVQFLRDNSGNTSYGPGREKMIFDAILALYTDDCINAFKAAGLMDPFTLVTGSGGGVVIGPSSLATNPANTSYMGVPEQARREILSEFGNTSSRAFTVMGKYTSDGRPRMFLNASALASGLGGLVSDMAHEFVHAAGVKGVKPSWYKPWQDDLSFDSKYQNIINTCRTAAQSFIDTRR